MALYEQIYPVHRFVEADQFRADETPWPLEVVTLSEGAATEYGTAWGVQTAHGITPLFDRDWIEHRTMTSPIVWPRSVWEFSRLKLVNE